jgi:hypothetical protein
MSLRSQPNASRATGVGGLAFAVYRGTMGTRIIGLVAAGCVGGLAGCFLFSSDTDCDDASPRAQIRNPASLLCEPRDLDAACSSTDGRSWGACDSPCNPLSEAACVAMSECRATYDHDCLFGIGTCSHATPYLGCFATDLFRDDSTGCAGLDAWSCSRHELCSATYRVAATCGDGLDQDGDGTPDDADECGVGFVRCIDEVVP